MNTSITDEKTTPEGTSIPPRTGLTPDVLPEVQTPTPAENSPTGVPTNYTQSARHWYALRATYGQESKANAYLVSQGVKTYYPTIKAFKMVNNKRKKVTQSCMLNIFFAHGTEDELKNYG